ncbi:MAG TPA: aminoacyl-tRNA hydrolase [Planctomycetota bacterium]|jgi:PTH1 family peptidyl-tRNA hydrolase|nr:aminoacyl-tRNA hydrolase [Planctomycetota bacterium]
MPLRIVVGLGNPGEEYRGTRHNAGFEVLDRVAADLGVAFGKPRWGRVPPAEAGGDAAGGFLLVKPKTYMNLSGDAVAKACEVHGASPADLLLVCDDLNLPAGRLRLRARGSAGGHHGLESVIGRLGTEEFARLRIGIGGVVGDAVPHVLGRFAPGEGPGMEAAYVRAAEAALLWLRGATVASLMNEVNRRPGSEEAPGDEA